jgi:aryl-alcohol dehydrogenase-like predicted oxidoreductase
MHYQLLGKSGLRVSELCLGTMTFGAEQSWGSSREESRRIFDKFAEAGGQFLDTANCYADGASERLLGDFVATDRHRFVLATKYSLSMRRDDPNAGGNHRKNMVASLEASLQRLQTDYIDVFWVHAWDFVTPAEEVMRGLDDLVRAGKILYCGISDTPAWIVAHAHTLAILRGWSPFIGLQILYSLMERTAERELLPMARGLGLSVTAWRALGSGILTGKYSDVVGEPKRVPAGDPRLSEKNVSVGEQVREFARSIGRSPAQVALNWVRQQSGSIIPIIGARTLQQLQDNLGALEFTLDPAQVERLSALTRIELGFPHDFLTTDRFRGLLFGDTFSKLRTKDEG